MRKLNTEEFIKKSKQIHRNKYDYSLVDYTLNNEKVIIICPIHGKFTMTPMTHLKGCGCKKCMIDSYKSNTQNFIEKSKNIHSDRYDYSLVNYDRSFSKVKIICPIHGIFEMRPNDHLRGQNCPICSERFSNNHIFIKKAIEIHGNKYNYSLVEYNGNKNGIDIICKKHSIFKQTPNAHLRGEGCPKCNESIGEKKIENFLIEKNIKYVKQKTFRECFYKKLLKFDFYLPDYNFCIEFDGYQHFNRYNNEFDDKKLNIRKKRDEIKNEFCLENNIKLIRISYLEDIKNILLTNIPV